MLLQANYGCIPGDGTLCRYPHNRPSFSVDPNDLFFREIRICADKSDPVLFILLVTDTNDLCRYLLFFSDLDFYRKQIFAASGTFFTDAEDLLDVIWTAETK